MNVARSVAEVLSRHTTLTLERVDRVYVNVYVQTRGGGGVAYFSSGRSGVACRRRP